MLPSVTIVPGVRLQIKSERQSRLLFHVKQTLQAENFGLASEVVDGEAKYEQNIEKNRASFAGLSRRRSVRDGIAAVTEASVHVHGGDNDDDVLGGVEDDGGSVREISLSMKSDGSNFSL